MRSDPKWSILVPSVTPCMPPAKVIDQIVDSPSMEPELAGLLEAVDTLVVTVGETDVEVVATIRSPRRRSSPASGSSRRQA